MNQLDVILVVMIVTGVVLAMHYNVGDAFNSVEHIMRDVNYGWLLRYTHANGAAMFFLAAYIHMFRGMYYGSYKDPREVLWILGVILYLLMMATGFLGYTLPWGQMSFHGAVVITNLIGALPIVGKPITPQPVGIAVNPKNTALKAKIQKAINAMYADGSMAKILKKWNMAEFALKK